MQITHEEAGTTLLTATLQDQAALYGLLLKLRQVNLPLLSLDCEELPRQDPAS